MRQIPIHRRINLHRVSIHALLAECDSMPSSILRRGPKFQSTHSLRSATQGFKNWDLFGGVSIHALLAECDLVGYLRFLVGRVSIHALLAECDQVSFRDASIYEVSIHALLAECDHPNSGVVAGPKSFNPRTPCGVRRTLRRRSHLCGRFQSTHSLRSATGPQGILERKHPVSIHALLAECDLKSLIKCTII